MQRRDFLKILLGAAATPIAVKLLPAAPPPPEVIEALPDPLLVPPMQVGWTLVVTAGGDRASGPPRGVCRRWRWEGQLLVNDEKLLVSGDSVRCRNFTLWDPNYPWMETAGEFEKRTPACPVCKGSTWQISKKRNGRRKARACKYCGQSGVISEQFGRSEYEPGEFHIAGVSLEPQNMKDLRSPAYRSMEAMFEAIRQGRIRLEAYRSRDPRYRAIYGD
jgi:hypothetical protein